MSHPEHVRSTPDMSPFQGLVDIGGRQLYAEMAGVGWPTVVLETGRGGPAATWDAIWLAVTALTRTVRYDRAGFGLSDSVDGVRTCVEIAADIHQLLHALVCPAPYVLVGHSLGGLTVRMYAHRYPEEVCGLVLVDPTHHEGYERQLAVLPPESPDESATLREMRLSLSRRTMPIEGEAIDSVACQYQVREIGHLGDLPLVVVTGTRRRVFTDLAPEVVARGYELKLQMHSELAQLSSRGTLLHAEQSGHDVPSDQPDKILEAIQTIVDTIRLGS